VYILKFILISAKCILAQYLSWDVKSAKTVGLINHYINYRTDLSVCADNLRKLVLINVNFTKGNLVDELASVLPELMPVIRDAI